MSKVMITEQYLTDIADAIREQTGGSDTYTPAQMGNAIRAIEGSGHSYSTTEHVIGTWIDGRDVYEKVVDLGALPNTTSKEVAHGITDADMYISVEGFFYGKNNGVPYGGHLPYVPSYNNSNNSEGITLFLEQSIIRVGTGMDRTTMSGYAVIRYVKSVS